MVAWRPLLPLIVVVALLIFEERITIPSCKIVPPPDGGVDEKIIDSAEEDVLRVMMVANLLLMGSEAGYMNIYFRDSYTAKFFRRKKGMGRQRFDIKKIENDEALRVTFSKRRAGLFKKAMELHTLCGAETALVVFSSTGKAYSFGHPSVDAVTDRVLSESPDHAILEAYRDRELCELNSRYEELCSQLEAEKKKADKLKEEEQNAGQDQDRPWWEQPIENLDLQQLEVLQETIQKLKNNMVHELVKNQVFINNSSLSFEPQRNSVNELAGSSTAVGPSTYPFGSGGAGHC